MRDSSLLMLLMALVVQSISPGIAEQQSANTNGNVSEKEISSQDCLARADAFMKGAASLGFYAMTVRDFLNISKNDSNWTIIDIRQPEEYLQGHIQGAVNIPLSDLIERMNEIPAENRIAVYCATNRRSPYGVMALRVFGVREAWVLRDGISAWREAGQPVVQPEIPG